MIKDYVSKASVHRASGLCWVLCLVLGPAGPDHWGLLSSGGKSKSAWDGLGLRDCVSVVAMRVFVRQMNACLGLGSSPGNKNKKMGVCSPALRD